MMISTSGILISSKPEWRFPQSGQVMYYTLEYSLNQILITVPQQELGKGHWINRSIDALLHTFIMNFVLVITLLLYLMGWKMQYKSQKYPYVNVRSLWSPLYFCKKKCHVEREGNQLKQLFQGSFWKNRNFFKGVFIKKENPKRQEAKKTCNF